MATAAGARQSIADQEKEVDDNDKHDDGNGDDDLLANILRDMQLEIEETHPQSFSVQEPSEEKVGDRCAKPQPYDGKYRPPG